MIRTTLLRDVLTLYGRAHRLADNSAYQLSHSVSLYARWLRRDATVADLADDQVSEFLEAMEGTHSRRTTADCRVNLLRVWREAAERGACDPPRRVRPEPKPPPMPIAWTLDELRRLLATCRGWPGTFRDERPRGLYLVTLIHAAYDTGLRRSDLWSLHREQVRADGVVIVRQQKTGWPHFPRLRETSLRGWAALNGDRPLRCPFHEASWPKFWRGVVARAGVRPGGLQQLRRTGATHLAIDHPEAVQRYLGHRTPTMQRHYVDLSIAQPQQILPPEF